MIVLWTLAIVGGLLLAVFASQTAVRHAMAVATELKTPPFLLGMTLMAIGTDLPEVANSIVASLAGHGDINVGDSVGSAATQATLVIGLLPWLVAGTIPIVRRNIALAGGLATSALLLTVVLVSDGDLDRVDALILLAGWLVVLAILVWQVPSVVREPDLERPRWDALRHGLVAFLALVLVALGSMVAVTGLVRLAQLLSAPEYIVSFLVLALGTSLPELAVAATALRRGQAELALGDALGSSLFDATLSIGIGPLIAPTAVTAALAVRGGLFAAGAVGIVTITLLLIPRLNRLAGAWLVLVYLLGYVVLLAR